MSTPVASSSSVQSTPLVRTFRDNAMYFGPGEPPQICRIVWSGHCHSIAFVPATADRDRGNETAALIADALNAYLAEQPERTPKGWLPQVPA